MNEIDLNYELLNPEVIREKLLLKQKLYETFCKDEEKKSIKREQIAEQLSLNQIRIITINNIVLNLSLPLDIKIELLIRLVPEKLELIQLLYFTYFDSNLSFNQYLEIIENIYVTSFV